MKCTPFCVPALIFAFLASCTSLTREPSPVPVQPGSSVWKVSRGGNTLFLGGSIHILRDTDFPFPEEFDRAFSRSAALVLEADVEQMANEEIVSYLAQRTLLPAGETLLSLLDEDTYELLAATCEEYGFSINNVARLKPAMIITMLSMFKIQNFGFVNEGVDFHYLEKARKENKPVYYLETAEAQIDALATMGEGYENEYVRYSLHDMESTENEIVTLVAEWKKGGMSYSEAILTEMMEEWPQIHRAMLTDRHDAWMPQIETFLDSGRVYFVVVGLLHLHGTDGLLQRLQDAGCTVEQFRN
jgi:uncharacterized protein YbaP (TraB family)